ncbi:autotransporter domain-containing protein [Martelella mediterranea]|uniref:T5SS/PEP-CTERM-associated repeat protein n=1 Tax=Martelella mediterranea TaxID=293089 RepID=A0A4R3NTL7_9HYPH|nr:autotransporter domain-containing protein [Martelella mediterranea]TCT39276.1 T5SS/PEP-CTERM-associated repeat protein [Martelella mediterranea]
MRIHRQSTLRRKLLLCSSALSVFISGAAVSADFDWTGAVSDEWYQSGNWNEGGAPATDTPGNGDNVTIGAAANDPAIPAGSGTEQLGTFIIGDSSAGAMTAEGAVTVDRAIFGKNAAGSGSLSLTGAAAYFNSNDYLVVGGEGSGLLELSAGARAFSTNAITIGQASGSVGTVTISGAGSLLRTSSASGNGLRIGDEGTGRITVSDGGKIESNLSVLGSEVGSSGTVELTGAGSEWNGYGDLYIGLSGRGDVSARDGAQIVSGSVSIGKNNTSVLNNAEVSGASSRWTVYNSVSIGGDITGEGTGGFGALSVRDGAEMTASNVLIGNVENSDGVINVDNSSKLTVSAGLRSGVSGRGELAVTGGGKVAIDNAVVGVNQTGDGAITVSGADSELTVTNGLTSGASGEGEVTISDGASLETKDTVIGQNAGSVGEMAVSSGARWTNQATTTVGGSGQATLSVTDGAVATSSTTIIGQNASGEGSVTVGGAGSSFQLSGDMTIGQSGYGLLVIEDGGSVKGTRSVIGAGAGSVGIASIAGGTWTVNGDLIVADKGRGALTLSGGGTVSASSIRVASSQGSAGSLNIGAGSGATPSSAGTLDVAQISFGSGDGRLVFNHTDGDYLFEPQINGPVEISVESGTTILTADNNNSGSTRILAGAELRLGDGGENGSLNGDIELSSDGRLAFDRADELDFRGTFSGSGTLIQDGQGAVRLSADSAEFSGPAQVNHGQLLVDGDLRKTSVSVASGALIGGSGTIGTTDVATGGIFQSGDRNGALAVDGDLSFDRDATYRALITENFETTSVTGDVRFDDTVVDLAFVPGGALQQNYNLLSAGSITGTYEASADALPPHFRGTFDDDGKTLSLGLAYVGGDYRFSELGRSVNSQLVRAFNDGEPLKGTLSAAMLLSGVGYENAMTTLGGELGVNGAVVATLGMQDFLRRSSNPSRLLAGWRSIEKNEDEEGNAPSPALAYWSVGNDGGYGSALGAGQARWDWMASSRARAYGPFNPDNAIWLEYNGQSGSIDTDYAVGNSGADLSGNTVEGGYLAAIDDTTSLGLVMGGGSTRYDQTDQDGTADDSSFRAAVSAAGQTKAGLYGTASLGVGVDRIETERTVSFSGVTDRLRGSFSATTVGGRLEAGGRIVNDGVALIPFAAASAVYSSVPGYREEVLSGSGQSALTYSDNDMFRGTVEAGIGFDTAAGNAARRFSLNGRVAYVYRYGPDRDTNAQFVSLPGYGFNITSNAPTGSAVSANVGARVQLSTQTDLSFNAYGEWADGYAALIASAKLRYVW